MCFIVGRSLNLNEKSQPSEVNRVVNYHHNSRDRWDLQREHKVRSSPFNHSISSGATAGSGYGKAQNGRHFWNPSDETTSSTSCQLLRLLLYTIHVQSCKLLVLELPNGLTYATAAKWSFVSLFGKCQLRWWEPCIWILFVDLRLPEPDPLRTDREQVYSISIGSGSLNLIIEYTFLPCTGCAVGVLVHVMLAQDIEGTK